MTVYEAMKRSMAPLKIYGEEPIVLDRELRVYASEIELLYTELDSMFKERFINTAEDVGLSVYEELFGPERSELSAEQRRRRLMLRMNLGEGDFTVEGVRKALDSLGLSYTISEFPELNKLNITAVTEIYTEAEKAFIEREINKIIPAHLDFQITFNTLMWSQLDNMNRTFAEIDNEDLTWKQIDSRNE